MKAPIEETRELSSRKYLFWLLGITFCIGTLGVTGAYLSGSRVFNYRFGMLAGTTVWQTGYLIEVLRLVVALSCATLGLIPGFRRQIRFFFGFGHANKQRRLFRLATIVVYVGVGVAWGAFQVSECVSFARSSFPDDSLQWGWEHGIIDYEDIAQEREAIARAYQFYSLYSVVFHGLIVPTLGILPLAAALEDMRFIYRHHVLIERADKKVLADRVLRFRNFLSLGGRKYVDLLGAIATFHIFQVFVGNLTLSESGRSAAAVGLGISLVSAVILFVIWLSYYSVRVIAFERLAEDSLKEHDLPSASQFVQDIVKRRLGGYAVLAAFVVSAPLQSLLNTVSNVF